MALWDKPQRRLFLSRDRVGICPLFYAVLGHTLIFASELKGVLAFPGFPRALDLRALGHGTLGQAATPAIFIARPGRHLSSVLCSVRSHLDLCLRAEGRTGISRFSARIGFAGIGPWHFGTSRNAGYFYRATG